MTPRANASRRGGRRSAASAMAMGTTAPPPAAWTMRAATSELQAAGEHAEHAPAGEDGQRHQVHQPAAVDVGDAAEQRHGHGVAEQVAGDDPGGVVQTGEGDVQVAQDRRQHGDDHGLVEGGDEDAGGDHGQGEVRARSVGTASRRGSAAGRLAADSASSASTAPSRRSAHRSVRAHGALGEASFAKRVPTSGGWMSTGSLNFERLIRRTVFASSAARGGARPSRRCARSGRPRRSRGRR